MSAAATRASLAGLGREHGEPLGLLGQLASFALDLLALRLLDLQHPDLTLAAEPRPLELGRGGALVRARRLLARLVLEPSDPGQVGPELGGALRARIGPCAQRLFEPGRNGDGRDQRFVEAVGAGGEPPQQGRIGRACCTEMRDLSVGSLGLLGSRCRLARLALGHLRLRLQLGDLSLELAAPALELEQDGLGGLAREPELAALRVEAEPFLGDRGDRCREQGVERDDGELGDTLGRPLADEHGQAAEPGLAGSLEQRQPGRRVVGHDRGRAPRERRRNRSLVAGVDVEERERELGAFVGERARSGRDPLALRERALERREPLLPERRTLEEVVSRMSGGARGGGRLVRGGLQLGRRRPRPLRRRPCFGQLEAKALAQRGG